MKHKKGMIMDCSLCGKKLKSSSSVKLGYGPVCYVKVYGKPAPKKKVLDVPKMESYIPLPGQINIFDYLNKEG